MQKPSDAGVASELVTPRNVEPDKYLTDVSLRVSDSVTDYLAQKGIMADSRYHSSIYRYLQYRFILPPISSMRTMGRYVRNLCHGTGGQV
jgi:hypothetical protein